MRLQTWRLVNLAERLRCSARGHDRYQHTPQLAWCTRCTRKWRTP